MGSIGSKASRLTKATNAASSTARKYPTRIPPDFPSSHTTASPGSPSSISPGARPTVHPKTEASFEKSESIKQDAQDPDFQSMLRTLGAVQIPDAAKNVNLAGQTNTNSSLHTLSRRKDLSDEFDTEASNPRSRGNKTWADTTTIKEILTLRDHKGWDEERIEKKLGLKKGVVARLGRTVMMP